MTQEETNSGNLLIAKFLEWKRGMLTEWIDPEAEPEKGFVPIHNPDGSSMRFNKSWDALMPAIQKFDGLSELFGNPRYTDRCEKQDDAVTLYRIESAYNVLVENLIWYYSEVSL